MNRQHRIEEQLRRAFVPELVEVEDESHRHSAGTETHYNVVVVSEAFATLGRVERHRAVFATLDGELKAGLHALTLTLRTAEEHTLAGGTGLASPVCASKLRSAS
ncbi:MAG: BolA family transcriptional regulator [Myxococcales bacterium]|nr:BolA family transcriptional regulator [Myxococcales bacterium]